MLYLLERKTGKRLKAGDTIRRPATSYVVAAINKDPRLVRLRRLDGSTFTPGYSFWNEYNIVDHPPAPESPSLYDINLDIQQESDMSNTALSMNLSLVAAIVDPNVRLLGCKFPGHSANDKEYIYKCLDPTIKVGDVCVVSAGFADEASPRFNVVHVTNEDASPEYNGNNVKYLWVVSKIDTSLLAGIIDWENKLIEVAKSAEIKNRRNTLRTMMTAELGDAIKDKQFKPEQIAKEG